jgi:3-methyladenine DNA glycosylase AlkD
MERIMRVNTGQIRRKLKKMGDPRVAARSRRFFKTGRGGYGEGDRFLGIRVPALRECAGEYRGLPIEEVLELLKSPYHEIRLLALLLLVARYSSARDAGGRRAVYRAYLRHTALVNNWDLVDSSAEHIVGAHLFERDRKPLYRLARSKNLWERRIAVMATFHFIRRGDFADTLAIAELLLDDPEDLIHKAAGWMLREVGKRDRAAEEAFLARHCGEMPRTMLRYAVEKFPERTRRAYMGSRGRTM